MTEQVTTIAENSKIAKYGERSAKIENATFIPFAITSQGHMGAHALIHLQEIAKKYENRFDSARRYAVTTETRSRLSFALANSAHRLIRCQRLQIPHRNSFDPATSEFNVAHILKHMHNKPVVSIK